jgi:hypothetical protein
MNELKKNLAEVHFRMKTIASENGEYSPRISSFKNTEFFYFCHSDSPIFALDIDLVCFLSLSVDIFLTQLTKKSKKLGLKRDFYF